MNRKLPSAWIFAVINSTRGELAGISDGTNAVASFSYDAAGRRTNRANANGTHTVTSYDAAGQILSIEHLQGTNVITGLSYGYNTGGNRTNRVENGIADTYTYDAIDQITGVNYSTNRTVSYGYDSLGSRTNVTDNSVPTAYTANNLNQYTAVGGASLGYDANGNLTSGPGSSTYNYDGNNRLISATVGTNSATFSHDARMRNVKRVVNGQTRYFYFDGWSLMQERDGSGNVVQNYVNGSQIDEIVRKTDSSDTVYYHADALGSVVALTDHTGDVVERYTYDIFGTPTVFDSSFTILTSSLQDNRFLFTGREWIEELGLYDYRNRIYSPELGRFLQTDSSRFEAEDVNLYRYAANDPTRLVDPLGTSVIDDIWKAASEAISSLFNILGIGVNYTPPMPECQAIGGFFTHCVNTCKLSRLTSGIGAINSAALSFAAAMYAGGDVFKNHERDWQGNFAGIVNSYKFNTCESSCATSLKKESDKFCCKTNRSRNADDPRCCP